MTGSAKAHAGGMYDLSAFFRNVVKSEHHESLREYFSMSSTVFEPYLTHQEFLVQCCCHVAIDFWSL